MAARVTDDTPIKAPINWFEHFEQPLLWQIYVRFMWNATFLLLVPLVGCKFRGFPFWGEDFCLGKEQRGNSSVCYLLLPPFPPQLISLNLCIHFCAPNGSPQIRFVWSLTCLTITLDFPSALLPPAGWCRATKQTFHHIIMPTSQEPPIAECVCLISCVSDRTSSWWKIKVSFVEVRMNLPVQAHPRVLLHTNTLLYGWLPCS